MNLKQRIKKIEAVIFSPLSTGETHIITLEQWRRLADGEDILPEIPERKREAFFEWRKVADERRRQAEETMKKFAD